MSNTLENKINMASTPEALLEIVNNMHAAKITGAFQGRKFVHNKPGEVPGEVHMRTILNKAIKLQTCTNNPTTLAALTERIEILDKDANVQKDIYINKGWKETISFYLSRFLNLFHTNKQKQINKLDDKKNAINTFVNEFQKLIEERQKIVGKEGAESGSVLDEKELKSFVGKALSEVGRQYRGKVVDGKQPNLKKPFSSDFKQFPTDYIHQITALIPDPKFWSDNAQFFSNALQHAGPEKNIFRDSFPDTEKVFRSSRTDGMKLGKAEQETLSPFQLYTLALLPRDDVNTTRRLYEAALEKGLPPDLLKGGGVIAEAASNTFLREGAEKQVKAGVGGFLFGLIASLNDKGEKIEASYLPKTDGFKKFAERISSGAGEFDKRLLEAMVKAIPIKEFWNKYGEGIAKAIAAHKNPNLTAEFTKVYDNCLNVIRGTPFPNDFGTRGVDAITSFVKYAEQNQQQTDQLNVLGRIFANGLGVAVDKEKAKACGFQEEADVKSRAA